MRLPGWRSLGRFPGAPAASAGINVPNEDKSVPTNKLFPFLDGLVVGGNQRAVLDVGPAGVGIGAGQGQRSRPRKSQLNRTRCRSRRGFWRSWCCSRSF